MSRRGSLPWHVRSATSIATRVAYVATIAVVDDAGRD
jgi:hypothetical protein